MNIHLQPVEDGLPARVFGPWVVQKLDYLARYIDILRLLCMTNLGARGIT